MDAAITEHRKGGQKSVAHLAKLKLTVANQREIFYTD
jgi:hypothetical protein